MEPLVAGGIRWNVSRCGAGPTIVLLHGTGGTVRTWDALTPYLAESFHCISLDLPGHGGSAYPGFERMTCASMASMVHDAIHALELHPTGFIGHSAGAAIMLQMAADGALADQVRLVGINPALEVPPSAARSLMRGPMGELLRSRVTRSIVRGAGRFSPMIELLLASTGSRLTPEQEREYVTAFASSDHAEAAYAMMANWDLLPLRQALPTIRHSTHFIVGSRDAWIPPAVARQAAALMPHARVLEIQHAGHLVHEERPAEVAALIVGALRT